MASLCKNPTLRDFQAYITEIETENGFIDESVLQKCLILGEELGELYKAVRKSTGLKIDPSSFVSSAQEEIADVFILLVAISNRLNIDLERAVREKVNKNSLRTWI